MLSGGAGREASSAIVFFWHFILSTHIYFDVKPNTFSALVHLSLSLMSNPIPVFKSSLVLLTHWIGFPPWVNSM